ncbi:MAG: HD domain-containing protein, partial [Gemmatimonadetes bacterium]|nr:HD domain-containing protein [Gemmatimonadota bacterium]
MNDLPPRLRKAIETYSERLDLELLARAYRFTAEAHRGQKRASGEDYAQHCVEVATILAELHLDSLSIGAAL